MQCSPIVGSPLHFRINVVYSLAALALDYEYLIFEVSSAISGFQIFLYATFEIAVPSNSAEEGAAIVWPKDCTEKVMSLLGSKPRILGCAAMAMSKYRTSIFDASIKI